MYSWTLRKLEFIVSFHVTLSEVICPDDLAALALTQDLSQSGSLITVETVKSETLDITETGN